MLRETDNDNYPWSLPRNVLLFSLIRVALLSELWHFQAKLISCGVLESWIYNTKGRLITFIDLYLRLVYMCVCIGIVVRIENGNRKQLKKRNQKTRQIQTICWGLVGPSRSLIYLSHRPAQQTIYKKYQVNSSHTLQHICLKTKTPHFHNQTW